MGIDQVDKALARYFFKQGSYDYFDDDGEGIFKAFCDENAFDADVIEEELDNIASECMLIDVDEDNFPFTKEPGDRDQAVYDVLKRCFLDPDAHRYDLQFETIEITEDDFKMNWNTGKAMSLKEACKRNMRHICNKGFV